MGQRKPSQRLPAHALVSRDDSRELPHCGNTKNDTRNTSDQQRVILPGQHISKLNSTQQVISGPTVSQKAQRAKRQARRLEQQPEAWQRTKPTESTISIISAQSPRRTQVSRPGDADYCNQPNWLTLPPRRSIEASIKDPQHFEQWIDARHQHGHLTLTPFTNPQPIFSTNLPGTEIRRRLESHRGL